MSRFRPTSTTERVKGEGLDPEGNRERACRRARVKVRRYCKANGLSRLGTLTWEVEPASVDEALRDVQRFWKAWRVARGGDAFPYAWVFERGEDNGRLHVHFVLSGPIPTRCRRCEGGGNGKGLEARPGEACASCVWGKGFVNMRRIKGRQGAPMGARAAARMAAQYVAKYVAKSYEEGTDFGRHRYEVAKGFQPEAVSVVVAVSIEDAVGQVLELYGRGFVWRSWADARDWQGPDVCVIFHDG